MTESSDEETRKAQALEAFKKAESSFNEFHPESPDACGLDLDLMFNYEDVIKQALSPAPDKWQTMDTAPRDGTHILLARKPKKMANHVKAKVIQAFWRGNVWRCLNGGVLRDDGAYGFKYLPTPPQDKK